ncbi:MAG: ATP-binding protein [Candidatus Sericytochromatia bacterium]|nr:ATP-binding protein [Candidatus Sericytochromatia bacterium]
MTPDEMLRRRAEALSLWGLVEHWGEVAGQPWVPVMLDWLEEARRRRSLLYRTEKAKLGPFKLMADFDWAWPKRVDREAVEDLFKLEFLEEAANVVLVGPNGVGKTMIAKNLAHQALLAGHSVRFVTASAMLADLGACEGTASLERALARYTRASLLVVDEVGYLSYSNRAADLLFEVVTRRYGKRPLVLTTNRPFAEWGEVFPNAACVVTLVDRLVHKAEVIAIAGDSYRAKEAADRNAAREKERKRRKKPPTEPTEEAP